MHVWELVQWLQDVVSGLLNGVYTKVNVFRHVQAGYVLVAKLQD